MALWLAETTICQVVCALSRHEEACKYSVIHILMVLRMCKRKCSDKHFRLTHHLENRMEAVLLGL